MAAPDVSPFYTAIASVFKGWTALQLAVTHSFGGSHSREKAEWLIGATEQWLKENSDIDSCELEEFLAEIMSSEFNSVVDDNSLAEVSTKICRFYDLTTQCKFEELNNAIGVLNESAAVSSCVSGPVDSDDDGDDDMSMGDNNMMSHLNALELSRNSTETDSTAEDSAGASQGARGDDSVRDSRPMEDEEDDGWTTVTKGGRKKRGG